MTVRSRVVDQLPGGLLLFAAAIMFTGAGIAVFSPALTDAVFSSDLREALASVGRRPTAWLWVNGLIVGAGILTTLGLVGLSLRFEGPSRQWAWMGMVAFAFAALFLGIERVLDMSVSIWAAERVSDASAFTVYEGFVRFDRILSDWFYILSFLSLGLYGVALMQIEGARERGWAFVAVGALGIILELVGATIPAMVFLGTGALGIATWGLGIREARATTN